MLTALDTTTVVTMRIFLIQQTDTSISQGRDHHFTLMLSWRGIMLVSMHALAPATVTMVVVTIMIIMIYRIAIKLAPTTEGLVLTVKITMKKLDWLHVKMVRKYPITEIVQIEKIRRLAINSTKHELSHED
jgi:hypothetical protein